MCPISDIEDMGRVSIAFTKRQAGARPGLSCKDGVFLGTWMIFALHTHVCLNPASLATPSTRIFLRVITSRHKHLIPFIESRWKSCILATVTSDVCQSGYMPWLLPSPNLKLEFVPLFTWPTDNNGALGMYREMTKQALFFCQYIYAIFLEGQGFFLNEKKN